MAIAQPSTPARNQGSLLSWMVQANKIGEPLSSVVAEAQRRRDAFTLEAHHAAILEAASTRIICNQEMPSLMPEGVHYAPTMLQALLSAKAIVRLEAKRIKKLHFTTYRITDLGRVLLDQYRAEKGLKKLSPLN